MQTATTHITPTNVHGGNLGKVCHTAWRAQRAHRRAGGQVVMRAEADWSLAVSLREHVQTKQFGLALLQNVYNYCGYQVPVCGVCECVVTTHLNAVLELHDVRLQFHDVALADHKQLAHSPLTHAIGRDELIPLRSLDFDAQAIETGPEARFQGY
jgi:hypothetical protein